MSASVFSSADPTALNFCSKTHQFSSKLSVPESISFTSHITKSRISIKNHSGPGRTRQAARIEALYTPAAVETAETLYQVLGIEESVSRQSDIKKAYKKMALKYHPDVSPPDRVDEYTRKFIMVQEAYETLSDPYTRASYDRDLTGGGSGAFAFSGAGRRSRQYHHQGMEEKEEWKIRWQSQLDELRRRNLNRDSGERMSWAARMRSQRQ